MQELDRRGFIKTAAVGTVGAFGLAGLNSARADASSAHAASSSVSATITEWVDQYPALLEKWNNDYVFPMFKKSHPHVSVEFINKGPNNPQALQTALAAGSGPTIVYEDATYMFGFAKAGDLAPLDEYAHQYNWHKKFLPWALALCTTNGHLYTVPDSLESMLMYYSPTLFEKHGWTVPSNYNDLVELCKEASKAGIIPMAGGNSDWHPATEWWLTSWWNNFTGPKLFYQALTGEAKFSDDAFVEGVASLKYFFDKGWIAGGSSKFFGNLAEVGQSQIASGQAALGPIGSWSFLTASTYFKPSFRWEVAPVPTLSSAVKHPVYPLSVGDFIGINKHASKAEQNAAAAFMDLYEANAVVSGNGLANAGREFGSVRASAADFPRNIPKQMAAFYQTLATKSSHGDFGFTTWTFLPAATDTYLNTALENVLTGSLSPKSYCQNIQAHFEKDKAAGLLRPVPKPTAFFA